VDELTRERYGDFNFAAEQRGAYKPQPRPTLAEIQQRRIDLCSGEIRSGQLLQLVRWAA
jgi:hypothetical protein